MGPEMGARQCSTRDLMRERMTRNRLCRAFVALAIAFVALGRVGAAFEEYDHGEDGSHHSRHERRHEKTTMSEYVRYMRTDFYGALNVTKDANATTISKRYRQLALKCHPDKLERTATAHDDNDENLVPRLSGVNFHFKGKLPLQTLQEEIAASDAAATATSLRVFMETWPSDCWSGRRSVRGQPSRATFLAAWPSAWLICFLLTGPDAFSPRRF